MVETSTFGSKFTAMKQQAVEIIKSLCYKLRMFGIPLEGPANLYCDNKAVFKKCVNAFIGIEQEDAQYFLPLLLGGSSGQNCKSCKRRHYY